MSNVREDVPLHRLYRHYSELPYSVRTLYTMTLLILGTAYLFAGIYLFGTYAPKDGNPSSLSYDDIVIAYSGSGKGSRLEAALRGPMSTMLPRDELRTMMAWAQEGAERGRYESDIRAIFDQRCMACHDGSNPHLPNLNGYDNVLKVTERDTGTALFTLVRVSHIHFFGIAFVFFVLGTIFSHAYVRPVWFKCAVVAFPFVALTLDIGSWYFTKVFHPFAWVVIAGGGLMALSFTYMWVISMWQMWFSKPPSVVLERQEGEVTDVG